MATASLKKRRGEKDASAPASENAESKSAKTDGTVATVPKTDGTVSTQVAGQHDDMVGSWNRSDERLPRINLIHKTSKSDLIKKFGIGSFVLNKEVKLSDGETPLPLTVLLTYKDYQQKLAFGDPETPTVYRTPDEVEANGGTLDYSKQAVAEGIYFQPRAHLQLVVAAPADIDEDEVAMFPYEFDGTNYAMALLTVASSAYTSVAKELKTLREQNKVMQKGLRFGRLMLTSESRKNAKNEWVVPVVKFDGENAKELLEFYSQLAK